MKKILNKLVKNEKGQAIPLVLILLVIGSIIIAPLMVYMSTGLKTGEVYEEKMARFYAADSGVEDAFWEIKNDKLTTLLSGYDPYAYFDYNSSYQWNYTLTENINEKQVDISLENVWIPKDIAAPSPSEARSIVEEGKLIISGSVSGASEYQINISYYYQYDDPGAADYDPYGDNLTVETIGIWLPPGFSYDGNCSLEGETYYSDPGVNNYCSGQAVVWTFSSVPLIDFPDSGSSGYPMVRTITFDFQSDQPNQRPGTAISWIETTRVTGIDYAWDADTKIYEITSTATDPATGEQTTVEAYTAKSEMRKLGSSIAGDYHAVGGTLMTATSTGYNKRYRERLFSESSATIAADDIPSSATVEAAYLYWSGWIDYHYKYQSGWWWFWGEIDELKYDSDNLSRLVEEEAKVNRVMFGISGNMTQITADDWQVVEDDDQPYTWSYSCFYDATDQVKQLIDNGDLGSNGSGTYILGHVPEDRTEFSYDFYPSGETGYPLGTPATRLCGFCLYPNRYQWAYAGWSLITIYSSPETKGHQLYLYDDLRYVGVNTVLQFPVSGFLAPDDTTGSHLTYFVGEGDNHYSGDHIELNGNRLSDAINPELNVFNSYSNALDDPFLNGIDIDTFDISNYVAPGDTSADVELDNGSEIYNLVYIILSFRSEVTTGGAITYLVR